MGYWYIYFVFVLSKRNNCYIKSQNLSFAKSVSTQHQKFSLYPFISVNRSPCLLHQNTFNSVLIFVNNILFAKISVPLIRIVSYITHSKQYNTIQSTEYTIHSSLSERKYLTIPIHLTDTTQDYINFVTPYKVTIQKIYL